MLRQNERNIEIKMNENNLNDIVLIIDGKKVSYSDVAANFL